MHTRLETRPARTRRRAALLVSSVLASTALSTLAPPPARAHPFGPPLRANVATEDDLVLVGWGAEEDDWVALGRNLGVFDGPGGVIDPEATVPSTGFERLVASEEVAYYLLDHVRAEQDGRACAGEVSFPEDLATFLATGAIVQLTCPDHVGSVELSITALTDLHDAYRTVTTVVGTDQRVVHTLDDPTHTVDPDAEPFALGRGHVAVLTALAALVCLGVGVVAGRRGTASHDGEQLGVEPPAPPPADPAPAAERRPEEAGRWS